MRTNLKTLLSTAAVVAALAGGSAVYAYADTPSQERSGSMMQGDQGGMMGQGGMTDMMGMMGMMPQISQMMETCNDMMQGIARYQGLETPKEGKSPRRGG